MNAKPKLYWDGVPRAMPSGGGRPEWEGIWLECEITDPPSSKGRNVDVFFHADTIVAMLRLFRDEARRVRQTPLSEAEG